MTDFNEYLSRITHLCGIEWSSSTIEERSERIEQYAAYAYAHGYRVDVAAKNLLRGIAYNH